MARVRGVRGSTPVPDPTELTDRAIARLEKAMRDYIDGQFEVRDTRLAGIDEATRLRLEQVTALHAAIGEDIDTAVAARAAVVDEKFRGVVQQFAERDTRTEKVENLNKIALDAAFAAQKEAAAKQDEANAKAIDKSEKATAETIKTNQELTRSVTDGLTKDVDALKLAVSRIESSKAGASESRSGLYATLGLIVTVLLFAMVAIGFFVARMQG